MKKVTFLLILVLSVGLVNAQSDRFTQAMLANLEKAKTAQNVSDFQEVANSFERIAVSEKNQWTAWYYAAWYNLIINFQESDVAKKQQFLNQAKKLIDEGLKVKPEESEFLVIKVMAYYAEMAINPSNAMDLFPKTTELLEKAKSLNANNPRIYLTQAEAIFNMPVEFGGGKEKAQPILLTAREKFDKFVPENQLSPDWGKERCDMLLAECKK
jgi:hypothetical protein